LGRRTLDCTRSISANDRFATAVSRAIRRRRLVAVILCRKNVGRRNTEQRGHQQKWFAAHNIFKLSNDAASRTWL
jgi:hypothetical protein